MPRSQSVAAIRVHVRPCGRAETVLADGPAVGAAFVERRAAVVVAQVHRPHLQDGFGPRAAPELLRPFPPSTAGL